MRFLTPGVDPVGSDLYIPDPANQISKAYKVEGIGQCCIPEVLDMSLLDDWVKTEDEESFIMAKRLIREEGLLVGGSAGAAMMGVIRYLRDKGLDQKADLR